MKKSAWCFAACAAALALLAACGSPTPAAKGDLDRIVTQGTVRVCSTGDYRPFTYHDMQGWSGLDIEMAQTLADIDRPGVRIVVNPGGTNAEFDAANIHHAAIVKYPDNNTIFDRVSGNKADAMITDASEIRWR
jgi:ABC-type amino acid transport substrate-binding protein